MCVLRICREFLKRNRFEPALVQPVVSVITFSRSQSNDGNFLGFIAIHSFPIKCNKKLTEPGFLFLYVFKKNRFYGYFVFCPYIRCCADRQYLFTSNIKTSEHKLLKFIHTCGQFSNISSF